MGAFCKRLYLKYVPPPASMHTQHAALTNNVWYSPVVVHSLSAVLVALGAYGMAVAFLHAKARRQFTIPEYYGTIATGYLITVDPMASTALQEAAQSKAGISRSLADCRFHIDVRTGVLGMKRVRTDKPTSKLQRLRAWLGRPWRAVFGAKTRRETDAEASSSASSASSMCSRCRSPATVATASSVTLLAQV